MMFFKFYLEHSNAIIWEDYLHTIIFMIHKSSLYYAWYQWAVFWMTYYYRHARMLLIPLENKSCSILRSEFIPHY